MTTKKKVPKRNSPGGFEKVRGASAQPECEVELPDLPIATGTVIALSAPTIPDVRKALLTAVLRQATSVGERRRLLSNERPVAVVIAVPSNSWIDPVKKYLEDLGRSWKIMAHTGQFKSEHNPHAGNDLVANALRKGRSVIGIATDPATLLPRTLVSTADVVVKLRLPTATVVQRVLRRHLSDHSIVVGDDSVVGLDLDDVVAAIRAGAVPTEMVDLLGRASRRRSTGEDLSSVPDLATAIEFGDAQTFALSLVKDIVDYKAGRCTWADSSKGAIFYGEPGNGKSILAAAIAKAASVPFIRYSVGSLFSRDAHLGTVLAAQREIYAKAALLSPCILMLDECESMPRRDILSDRGRDWWLPVIDDALLLSDAGIADADGTGGGRPPGVVLLGATNALELVDPAFLRPNRFEVAIEIGRPNAAGVENILRFHLRAALAKTDLSDVARMIEGATAAEVMDVVRTARRTARHASRDLTHEDLVSAASGNDGRSEAKLWRCAVHESGHAVAVIATGAGTLVHATLQGRGQSSGHVRVNDDDDDDDLETLAVVEGRVVAYLAAGAAEQTIIGSLSSGSGGSRRSDLGVVSAMLARVHTTTFLTGELFHRADESDALSAARGDPDLRRRIELHLQDLNGRALELAQRHRDRIVAVAQALVRRRYLDAAAIVDIVSEIPQNDEKAEEAIRSTPTVVEGTGTPRRGAPRKPAASKGSPT